MMVAMHIDRLIIRAPGLSEAQGRQLALGIAARLAEAGGMPAAGDIPRLEVRAPAAHRADGADLAERIVDAALRQLRRSI
jgi:hypothetical protein